MVVDNVLGKAPFANIGKRGTAKGAADEQYVLLPADPGRKMFGGVKVELGKAHTVEFEAGELLEVFELGNGVVGVFMDINDFRGQIDEVGEEVTELFDGVDAFAAGVIGHKKVLE